MSLNSHDTIPYYWRQKKKVIDTNLVSKIHLDSKSSTLYVISLGRKSRRMQTIPQGLYAYSIGIFSLNVAVLNTIKLKMAAPRKNGSIAYTTALIKKGDRPRFIIYDDRQKIREINIKGKERRCH